MLYLDLFILFLLLIFYLLFKLMRFFYMLYFVYLISLFYYYSIFYYSSFFYYVSSLSTYWSKSSVKFLASLLKGVPIRVDFKPLLLPAALYFVLLISHKLIVTYIIIILRFIIKICNNIIHKSDDSIFVLSRVCHPI